MDNQRVYFVIDMKSFYASCECSLRGLDPYSANLVVADSERTEKTICLAVSINMKKLGVKNRCRLFQIPKNIDFICAKPRMQKYIDMSAEIYGIYLNYIDKKDIHVYSIDECFIDVTDYLKLYNIKAKSFAKKLMNEIYEKLHIPSSCGIGTNLYLAKIALDISAKNSPDRIGWLTEEKYIKELSNHKPITDFWRISSGTARRLAKYCVYDMEGIRKLDEKILEQEFGIDAELLIDHANGIETCLMEDIKNYKSSSKSISESQILPCGYSYNDALIVLKEMVRQACLRLYKNKYVTNALSIGIYYDDISKGGEAYSTTMSITTSLYSLIIKYVDELFLKIKYRNIKIRRLGFSMPALDLKYEHYDLFCNLDEIEKEKRLMESMINIKDKYGKNSVLEALDYLKNSTQRERNLMIGGHASGEDGKRKKS